MAEQFVRESIGQGVHFSTVRDPKFKHNRLTLNMILPLRRETASNNAAVPYILRMGSRELPDLTAINTRLAELYGATLDAEVGKYGGSQILEVSIKGLDNRFALENEDITALCAGLLAEIALDPKVVDGGFDPQITALQRQYVLDSIDAEINDKRAYAMTRCMQVMCAGEPVALRRYGEREDAEKISPDASYSSYQKAIETAQVEIFFTGSGDPDSAREIFRERFAKMSRNPLLHQMVQLRTKADAAKEQVDTLDVSQSKLVMGMRTGGASSPQEISARRVMAALYGGTPFSKLFLNVRERLSLCYYCAARFDVSTGLMLVDSGVEQQNRQLAQDEIIAQLGALQRGEFTDEELFNTKMLIKNSVISSNDSPAKMEGWYLAQVLRNQQASPEEDCEAIDQITRDQVVEAAKAVTLDTVYFLTGNQEQEGA